MRTNLRLHARFIRMMIASRMAYRIDYAMSFLAYLFMASVGPLYVAAIYHSGGTFPGWSLPELLLLQGALTLVKGFSFMLFFGMLWGSQELLRHGTFDLLLIRPVPVLHQLAMANFDAEDIGQFISGLAVTAIALWLLPPVHGSWLAYLALLSAGILFYLAIAIFCVVLTMRVINTGRLYEIVDAITIFAMYPKSIYTKGLGLAFTTVLPLLVAGFYPASALLGKATEGAALALACSLGFLALALWVWRGTLKRYTSAGG